MEDTRGCVCGWPSSSAESADEIHAEAFFHRDESYALPPVLPHQQAAALPNQTSRLAAPLSLHKLFRLLEFIVRQQLVPLIAALENAVIESQQQMRNHRFRCSFHVLWRNGWMLHLREPWRRPGPILEILNFQASDLERPTCITLVRSSVNHSGDHTYRELSRPKQQAGQWSSACLRCRPRSAILPHTQPPLPRLVQSPPP